MEEIILGFHTGHDRGAAIIVNNKVICAISQERLDGDKHSMSYQIPFKAIDSVLNYCKITIEQLTCVGFSSDSVEAENILDFIQDMFYEKYRCTKIPFYSVGHHLAHAEAVFTASGFEKSLIIIADGGGDFCGKLTEAESIYLGVKCRISKLEARLQNPPKRKLIDKGNHIYPLMPKGILNDKISIGRKYEQITYMLGFGFGQAGKTMGLASYGKNLINLPEMNQIDSSFKLTYRQILEELYCLQLAEGKTYFQFLNDHAADIAKTIQDYTENITIAYINGLIKKYNIHDVCLGGGLFLNCMMNHKILSECAIDNYYIFPASGDDGQAVGAAIHALKKHTNTQKKITMNIPYLGLSYTNNEIESALKSYGLKYHYEDDNVLAKSIAKSISEGKILGLHRGRTEIGPRALCHRSILADATNPDMKDILNERIKHRENFRPFAPVVTYEKQFEIFKLKCDSPYMLLAADVAEEYKKRIPSVTHIDGTARVQSIRREKEPFIYSILNEFEIIKGIPVILNTSFNVAGKPIVESPDITIKTFLSTEIDVLVIGNYIVYKSQQK